MNPKTMTLQACCDWLARSEGWGLPGDKGLLSDGTSVTLTKYHKKIYGQMFMQSEHPFPPTLNAIAAAMPKGVRTNMRQNRDGTVDVYGITEEGMQTHMEDQPDEILARARLAVACRMADKEKV